MKNKILRTSWGYDMTHNDYVMVISENGKTALCQMIGAIKIDGNGYYGTEIPDPTRTSNKSFRLRIRDNGYYKGSYPFIWGHEESKRMGSFTEWDGTPDFYNYND